MPGLYANKLVNTSSNLSPLWYPVHLDLRQAASSVRWVDLSGVAFNEPFFHHTVNRAGGRRSMMTALGESPAGAEPPSIAPSAFIFHVSRCGSTLLCNIFRALNRTHVVAEPQPIMALLSAYSETPGPYAAEEWAQKRDQLLRQMMQGLGQPPMGSASRYIVKFTSYCAARMDIIRSLWPEVPIVFLVRDPVEVMVSNLNRAPGWMKLRERPQQLRNLFGWADESHPVSREEFCARAFGQLCQSALRHKGPRSMVMDYQDLISGGWNRVFAFLGLDAPDAGEQLRIAEATKTYSKDAAGEVRFEPDAREKRDRVTPEIRDAADRWARPHLLQLLRSADGCP